MRTHVHDAHAREGSPPRDTIDAMQDALDPQPAPTTGLRSPVVRLVSLLVLAGLLVGIATWQVGPEPRDADEGFPDSPPPLALPSDEPANSALSRAAAELAAGDLDDARRRFTTVVAEDREGEAGQVGLVLSRWRSTGPESVERDLRQLAREYPESAFVALHLGLVQLLLEQTRSGRESLRSARELGLDAADPTSLRMARLADDLLHPQAFRGTMPVLVQPTEVAEARREDVRELLGAVAAGDRRRIARLADELAGSGDAMVELAVLAAGFDKGDPDVTVDRLERVAAQDGPPRVRDRARFLATLAELWGGGDREAGCVRLRRLATGAEAATRRLAVPIHRELCAP